MEEQAVKTEQASKTYTQKEVDEILAQALRQQREFLAQVIRNAPDLDLATRQYWIGNPKQLQGALSDFLGSLFVVNVDCAIMPIYPDWVDRDETGVVKLLHPELETTGPAEFNLAKDVSLWLHESQQNGGVTDGKTIHEYLQDHGMLPTCLSLQEGLAIQQKGIVVFQKFSRGKAIVLWKSVVRYRDGDLYVPYLREGGGLVVVSWRCLNVGFSDDHLAARFSK